MTAPTGPRSDVPLADRLVHLLTGRGLTVATGESLTGGLVCAELVRVPGASECVRGGVVGYSYDVKSSLLGVPRELLAERGAVNAEVAQLLAEGAARACAADVGLATTGAAGPTPADGEPPGTVFVAVVGAGTALVRRLRLDGDRGTVRAGAVRAVVALALESLGEPGSHRG